MEREKAAGGGDDETSYRVGFDCNGLFGQTQTKFGMGETGDKIERLASGRAGCPTLGCGPVWTASGIGTQRVADPDESQVCGAGQSGADAHSVLWSLSAHGN